MPKFTVFSLFNIVYNPVFAFMELKREIFTVYYFAVAVTVLTNAMYNGTNTPFFSLGRFVQVIVSFCLFVPVWV
jgi:hypothetical protein